MKTEKIIDDSSGVCLQEQKSCLMHLHFMNESVKTILISVQWNVIFDDAIMRTVTECKNNCCSYNEAHNYKSLLTRTNLICAKFTVLRFWYFWVLKKLTYTEITSYVISINCWTNDN